MPLRPTLCRERSDPRKINGAAGFGAGALVERATVGAGALSGAAVGLGSARELWLPPREREEGFDRAGAVPLDERDGEVWYSHKAQGDRGEYWCKGKPPRATR